MMGMKPVPRETRTITKRLGSCAPKKDIPHLVHAVLAQPFILWSLFDEDRGQDRQNIRCPGRTKLPELGKKEPKRCVIRFFFEFGNDDHGKGLTDGNEH